ncbi:MAG TPA: ABC transporter permease [Bryobacteraceae bacterium]|nr:ABC transporter permease [Bryobacteraceae bacterium]
MALQQVRHAARSLIRVPALTMVSVITVALGVGAGTALFSVVKAVILNPLPYPDAEKLVWLSEMNKAGRPMSVSLPNYLDWSAQNHTFGSMTAFAFEPVNASADVPQRITAALVTPGFFETLGVQPTLGRGFLPADHVPGAPLAAVVGHALWQRLYGGDTNALGRMIRMSGYSATIIGVMPAGFSYPENSELWISTLALGENGSRTSHNFRVVGRLKPDIAIEQAQTDLSEIAQRLYRQYPGPWMGRDAILVPLRTHVAGSVRLPLLILFAAVGLLLLIVCVNVANLLLVRVASRSRELALRLALGAGRPHLVRQMLTESLLLAIAGGALGFLLAFWSMDLLKLLLPADVPRAGDIHIDSVALAFALVVSGAAGLLFGLFPAWRATHMNVHDAVKSGSRTMTSGRGARLVQSCLVVSEVCLSLALLAGAGLLVRSFARLQAVEPGFRADGVIVSDLFFSFPKNEIDRRRLIANYADLLARVRALPGVESAGTASAVPIMGAPDGAFTIENNPHPARNPDADYVVASPGYFKTLRIPLIAGREFTDADTASAPGAAIVSAEMARVYWPGRSPIGERIWFGSFESGPAHWLTIVGVAADVHEGGLTKPVFPMAYVCYAQASRLWSASLLIRSRTDRTGLSAQVRSALHAVNPEATVSFTTMDAILSKSLAQQRFQMQVLGGFAVLALLLAAVGLYGVLSYMVNGSRAEIGVRMALGAPPIAVFRLVALRALTLVCAGAVLGLGVFLTLRKLLAAVLFGIGPSDPVTLAGAVAILLAVALAAALVPARRAMQVDPVTALRNE